VSADEIHVSPTGVITLTVGGQQQPGGNVTTDTVDQAWNFACWRGGGEIAASEAGYKLAGPWEDHEDPPGSGYMGLRASLAPDPLPPGSGCGFDMGRRCGYCEAVAPDARGVAQPGGVVIELATEPEASDAARADDASCPPASTTAQ